MDLVKEVINELLSFEVEAMNLYKRAAQTREKLEAVSTSPSSLTGDPSSKREDPIVQAAAQKSLQRLLKKIRL